MRLPEFRLSNWLIAAVLTAAMILATTLSWQPLTYLENKSYDFRQRMRQSKPTSPVVIIAVDDQSITSIGRWPWPRSYMGELIDVVSTGKPSMIALNILYTEPERNPGLEEIRNIKQKIADSGKMDARINVLYNELNIAEQKLDSDATLSAALKNSKNVLLPLYISPGELPDGDLKLAPKLKQNSLEAPKGQKFINAVEETLPIDPLLEEAAGIGHFNLFADKDGTLRTESLFVQYKGRIIPSLALQTALLFSGNKISDVHISSGKVQFSQTTIPIDKNGKMQIDFRGKFGTFPSYSFIDVISNRVSPETFKGKIVLIGTVATGIASFENTPPQAGLPGIEITANTIDTILSRSFIIRPIYSTIVDLSVLLTIGAFLAFMLPRMKAGVGAIVTASIFTFWNALSIWLFSNHGIWLLMAAPSLLLIAGYTSTVSARFMTTEKRKELIESDSIETSKMLGLSFQGQGLLDLAFEKFRKCPITDNSVKDLLYNLALDFERKRMFNKAAAVYEHIGTAGDFKDISQRIATLKQAEETSIFGVYSNRKENTVILDRSGAATPTIGRFEIQKELGRGAMGTVYLGRDPKINRNVAIKTIRFDEIDPEQATDIKQRFFREAEAAGSLNHPNIVTIYDVGEDYDLAYVAMELLDGCDLCDYLKPDKKLSHKDLLKVIGAVAEGLDFAHQKGIVHRDIKPANIMRLKSGEIKIADFGIARITASSATQTGTLFGTPSYMSPEQVAGQKVDGRSDIFSLGVVMYELLSCRKPFTGESITGIMYNIVHAQPILLTKIDPTIPECCAYIAHKMLLKERSKRYQSGREIADHCRLCLQKLG